METDLDLLRKAMLDAFEAMDSEMTEPYRATACLRVRDCLSQAHELGFDVTIRFSQGRREIGFVKTEEPAALHCGV